MKTSVWLKRIPVIYTAIIILVVVLFFTVMGVEREILQEHLQFRQLCTQLGDATEGLYTEARLYMLDGDTIYRDRFYAELYDVQSRQSIIENLTRLDSQHGQYLDKALETLDSLIFYLQNSVAIAESGDVDAARIMTPSPEFLELKALYLERLQEYQDYRDSHYESELANRQAAIKIAVAVIALPVFVVLALVMKVAGGMSGGINEMIRRVSSLETDITVGDLRGRLSEDGEWGEVQGIINRLMETVHDKLIDTAPIVYAVVEDDVIIDANQYARERLGMKPGERVPNFYHNPDRRGEILGKLEKEGYLQDEQIKFKTITGEPRRFHANVVRLGADHRSTNVLWAFDIEGLETRNDEIRRNRADLQKLIDALPLALMIQDAYTRDVLYINNTYFSLFECGEGSGVLTVKESELLLQGPDSTTDPVALDMKYIKAICESNITITVECRYKTHGGNVFDASVTGGEILYNGSRAIVKIIQDISEGKAQTKMLQSAAEKEREANQIKSRFLVNMSHEIRTPMNAIIGMSQLALLRPQDGENSESFKKIHVSAKNLLTIINDILDFSKMEAKKMEIVEEEFFLEDILANAFMVAAGRLEQKSIQMLARISPNIPAYLYGDRTRLWQVLKNLLDNSAKYTNAGRIILSAEQESRSGEDVALVFTVTDTGIGMSPDQVARIFEPFEQFNVEAKSVATGTGLGMSITKQIVELLGGQIEVSSAVGIGTTTVVRLPFKDSKQNIKLIDRNLTGLRGKRILIVDGDEAACEIMAELAAEMGAEPSCIPTVYDALSFVSMTNSGGGFDIVVIQQDDDSTGTAGSAVAKLQSLLPGARFVQSVSNGRKMQINELRSLGFKDAIEKPFMPNGFNQCLSGVGGEQERHRLQITFKGARVLLCEDNLTNQEVARGMLDLLGIETVIAENGEEGIKALAGESFDLVLMDVLMPVMDGYEATTAIRQSAAPLKNIPILALTANAMAEERQNCLSAGMNGHIPKPVDFEELVNELTPYLSKYMSSAAVDTAKAQEDSAAEDVEIEGADTEAGLARFMGNRQRYKRALLKFAEELRTPMPALPEDNAPANWRNELLSKARNFAHGIKGSSGNLGLMPLFELSRAVEDKIKAGEPDIRLYNKLKDLREVYAERITSALEGNGEAAEEAHGFGTTDEQNALIDLLHQGLVQSEPDICEEAIFGLTKKGWPGIKGEIVAELARLVDGYDFDGALDVMEELFV